MQPGSEKNTDKEKKPLPFWAKICIHLGLMFMTFVLILWLACLLLDVWTHHGEYSEVPGVEGLGYNEAVRKLVAEDFQCEISDSIFDTRLAPGVVVAQLPKVGSKVKGRRVIYLTVNAFSPKTVRVPQIVDMSHRQAVSTLESLGFTRINVREVPSEFKGLVLSARYNGRPLQPGMRVPVNATIVLEVGAGYVHNEDSIDVSGDVLTVESDAPVVSFDMFD